MAVDEKPFKSKSKSESETVTVQSRFHASIAHLAFPEGASGSSSKKRKRPSLDADVDAKAKTQASDDLDSNGPNSSPLIERNPKRKKKKKKRGARGYASPETYAHLHFLQDHLSEELDVVFCGINPGQKSAQVGHHFAHPTNHFWACLHESGFTSTRIRPEEDHTLPEHFSLGLTNLVDRPTAEESELSTEEQFTSVPDLLSKITRYRPRIVCFVGLGIAKTIQNRVLKDLPASFSLSLYTPPPTGPPAVKVNENKRTKPTFQLQKQSALGLQTYKMVHALPTSSSGSKIIKTEPETSPIVETLFYALPSTSARVVSPQKSGKILLFRELKALLGTLKHGKLDTDEMHTIQFHPISTAA